AEYKINFNVTVTGIFPHMHLIGRSIKAYFVSPAKDTTWLVDIPEWDFHWQGFYGFQKPIFVPAGSTLYGEATYDNTTANPNNPNSPPITVNQGEGTADEMFLIYFNFTGYQSGDEQIIIDTSSHYSHHASCFNTTGAYSFPQSEITVSPNPVRDLLHIRGARGSFRACLYSGEGRVVLEQDIAEGALLNMNTLPSGIYYLCLKSEGLGVRYFKVQKE
ncbi:MAG: T9SS type A sorting domain-containing protein, partial [Bacteroidetes bacterium]|nr:T9SS type A sorting domain-containing protein [Bacteroidota bacterium]